MADHRVVIVGGGFGGLYLARALARVPVEITLLDRKNHHTFQPLLYQVATAGLNASNIAAPIRRILRRQRNVEVLLADVESVDLAAKRVQIHGERAIDYDTLVLAPGATHSYFGHPEWAHFAPGLKTIEDALEIRKRVYYAFEAAEREDHPEHRKAWLTFVVVGGGPTGVELAGTLSEVARKTVRGDFRRINPADARVLILEGAKSILTTYPPDLQEKAMKQLADLGVEVQTGSVVTGIDAEGVQVGDRRVAARTVMWAAGVAASPLLKTLGVPLDRAGRVLVNADLSVPGHPEVYVIGDASSLKQEDGSPVPGVAPAAIQEARHTATNIELGLEGLPRQPFRYHDKGSLATIGRSKGIALIGKLKLSGFVAWLSWLVIHIFFLIGFRNRLVVMFDWAIAYFTYSRGARLITGEVPPLESAEAQPALPARPPAPPSIAARAPEATFTPARGPEVHTPQNTGDRIAAGGDGERIRGSR